MSKTVARFGADFPHTGIANSVRPKHQSVEWKRYIDRRLARMLPHVDELLCAHFFLKTGESISLSRLGGRQQAWGLCRLRALGWWILRNHPDAELSYPVIGRAYDRDHTTIMHGVERIRWLILDGRGEAELRAIQWLCDQLARRGFTPIKAEDFV